MKNNILFHLDNFNLYYFNVKIVILMEIKVYFLKLISLNNPFHLNYLNEDDVLVRSYQVILLYFKDDTLIILNAQFNDIFIIILLMISVIIFFIRIFGWWADFIINFDYNKQMESGRFIENHHFIFEHFQNNIHLNLDNFYLLN